jgi:tyrosine-protein kinase Etk/Wzc
VVKVVCAEIVRITKDDRVNTDLYTALLNTAQQLRLVKAGKMGNVRLVDAAMVPGGPIKTKRSMVTVIAVLLGLLLGVMFSMGCKMGFFDKF